MISTNEDDRHLYHEAFRVGNAMLPVEQEIRGSLKPGQTAFLSLSVELQNQGQLPIWSVTLQATHDSHTWGRVLMSQLADVDDALAEVVWSFAARSSRPKMEMGKPADRRGYLVLREPKKKSLKTAKKRSRIKPTP